MKKNALFRPILFCLILVLASASLVSAQTYKGWWRGVDLSQLGYQRHSFNWDVMYPTDSARTFQVPNGPASFSLGHTYMRFEVPARGVYFSMDASFLTDLFVALVARNGGMKEVYPGQPLYQMMDVFPTKLAFGGFVTDWFAIYGGGQWSYTGVGNGDYQTSLIFGGNYRGFGLHMMGGPKWMFMRYSLMHDWVRKYKRTYKGTALTHELSLFIAPFKTTEFGFCTRLQLQNTKMDAMLENPRFSDAPFMPAVNASALNISFGIFAEGLVSGTSRAISKSTYEIYGPDYD
jgi:hypothetical protein